MLGPTQKADSGKGSGAGLDPGDHNHSSHNDGAIPKRRMIAGEYCMIVEKEHMACPIGAETAMEARKQLM